MGVQILYPWWGIRSPLLLGIGEYILSLCLSFNQKLLRRDGLIGKSPKLDSIPLMAEMIETVPVAIASWIVFKASLCDPMPIYITKGCVYCEKEATIFFSNHIPGEARIDINMVVRIPAI